jgi:GH25 family lysozyme M1 (1,4-beta-N-acetylmuramidase)
MSSALRLEALSCLDYFPYVRKLRRVTILRAAVVGGVAVALSLAMAPDVLAAPDGPSRLPSRGLDISAYQHRGAPIDWLRLAREGLDFVAVKAAEGTYYQNPYYPADTRAAAAAGLAVLPYVFANPSRASGAATARFAVRAADLPRGPARLPLVVDLENDPYKKHHNCYGLRVPAMLKWIAGFVGVTEARTGRRPVIYTTDAWWQQCTASTGEFRADPLWLASFGVTAPAVPSPWRQWNFWQYASNGLLPGVGRVDLDYYQPTGALPALREPVRPAKPGPSAKPKHRKQKPKQPKKKHSGNKHPKTKQHKKKPGKPEAKRQKKPGKPKKPSKKPGKKPGKHRK